jgi:hypothetical protein
MRILNGIAAGFGVALAFGAGSASAGGFATVPATSASPTWIVQLDLLKAGFNPGPLDGLYGPHTRAAVRSLQFTESLEATGIFDRGTAARLDARLRFLKSAALRPPAGAPLKPSPIVATGDDHDRQNVIELYSAACVDDESVRRMSVDLLADMKTDRAFAALKLVLLSNTFPSVRVAAARKLGEQGDLDSLYALAFGLETELDPAVRTAMQEELDRNLPVELPPKALALRP